MNNYYLNVFAYAISMPIFLAGKKIPARIPCFTEQVKIREQVFYKHLQL